MHKNLAQNQKTSILDINYKPLADKLIFNHNKNKQQDQTDIIDSATKNFDYQYCKDVYWNPENLSLLYATPIWYAATTNQKIILNQLYWVAYYSQIISAEIATIFFNHVTSTGLYSLEDFRLICDTLDLESSQERAHINAFKTISEDIEYQLFGQRLFTYPMRGPFDQTMCFADRNIFTDYWRKLKLKAFALIAPDHGFLASQYMLIRGLRTLNGKLIQHKLARDVLNIQDKSTAAIPAQISCYHFMDESYHFNTSKLIGIDLATYFAKPTKFEKIIINKAVAGCQKDHYNFSIVVNGIFWYEPALFHTIYKLLRSPVFNYSHQDTLVLMHKTFCIENEAMHLSYNLHKVANKSYQHFVEPLEYLNKSNKEMSIMAQNNINKYIRNNKNQFIKFKNSNAQLHYNLSGQ